MKQTFLDCVALAIVSVVATFFLIFCGLAIFAIGGPIAVLFIGGLSALVWSIMRIASRL